MSNHIAVCMNGVQAHGAISQRIRYSTVPGHYIDFGREYFLNTSLNSRISYSRLQNRLPPQVRSKLFAAQPTGSPIRALPNVVKRPTAVPGIA
jgi:hypothetical protein